MFTFERDREMKTASGSTTKSMRVANPTAFLEKRDMNDHSRALGWAPATTARMAKRYGHVSMEAKKLAVATLDVTFLAEDTPQDSPQSAEIEPFPAPY